MEYVYRIVAIRVNETSWAHVWWLCSHYLGTGCDTLCPVRWVPHDVADRPSMLFGSREVDVSRALWFVPPKDPLGIGGPVFHGQEWWGHP
jgi:hypothetical protein